MNTSSSLVVDPRNGSAVEEKPLYPRPHCLGVAVTTLLRIAERLSNEGVNLFASNPQLLDFHLRFSHTPKDFRTEGDKKLVPRYIGRHFCLPSFGDLNHGENCFKGPGLKYVIDEDKSTALFLERLENLSTAELSRYQDEGRDLQAPIWASCFGGDQRLLDLFIQIYLPDFAIKDGSMAERVSCYYRAARVIAENHYFWPLAFLDFIFRQFLGNKQGGGFTIGKANPLGLTTKGFNFFPIEILGSTIGMSVLAMKVSANGLELSNRWVAPLEPGSHARLNPEDRLFLFDS